jgi:hypothetical protein
VIIGGSDAGKRIDIFASALFQGMTDLDLSYTQPLDPVQMACRREHQDSKRFQENQCLK